MRPGLVVTIRINPSDCMSVLDVVRAAGLDLDGASFASLTSLALGSLLETMRRDKIIPTRTGFEYMEMMAGYHGSQRTKKKVAVANAIHTVGSDIATPALEPRTNRFSHVHLLSAVQHVRPLSQDNAELSYPPVEPAVSSFAETARQQPVEAPQHEELAKARERLTRLCEKRDMCEDLRNGMSWTGEDESEYNRLCRIVYPEG